MTREFTASTQVESLVTGFLTLLPPGGTMNQQMMAQLLCVLTTTHLNRHAYDQVPQQDIPWVVARQFACE